VEASGGGELGRTAGLSMAAAWAVRGEEEKGRKEEEESVGVLDLQPTKGSTRGR
jgi:hypothetical protein